MTMPLEDLARHVEGLLDGKLVRRHIALAELTVVVVPEQIVSVLAALRDDSQCQFEQLIDICGVDYPERAKRFDVVYHLLSPRRNQRIRIKCETDADTPVPSVIGVFPAANWYEREAYDMYGILFSDRLWLPGLPAAQGLPPHRLRRGPLRRRPQARRLRARQAHPGVPQF
jgi:NADH-quinone oxidoreductase subunit C